MLNKSFFRIDIFDYALNAQLKDNLSGYLLSTISNMLALNYASDEKLQESHKNIQNYADDSAIKLLEYIGEEVILDETFDAAMYLFAIAISPKAPPREAPPDLTQNKTAIIDIVQNICFNGEDISAAEREGISAALSEILDGPNAGEIIALISTKPELLRALIRKKTKDISSSLSDIAKISGKSSTIMTDFKQFSGLIICGLIGCLANVAAVHSIDAIAAVTVIPTSVIALRYGTKIGEIIGAKLSQYEGEFKEARMKFTEIVDGFMQGMTTTLDKDTQKTIAEMNISDSKLNDVVKSVSSHIAAKENVEKLSDFDMIKQKARNIGRDNF